MTASARTLFRPAVVLAIAAMFCALPSSIAQDSTFHSAPASAAAMKNPYQGDAQAAAAGKKLFGQNCVQCHGKDLQGVGPAPPLDNAATRSAKPGEMFWFITNGNLNAGMPSWAALPKQQRWQIVTFLQAKIGAKAAGK